MGETQRSASRGSVCGRRDVLLDEQLDDELVSRQATRVENWRSVVVHSPVAGRPGVVRGPRSDGGRQAVADGQSAAAPERPRPDDGGAAGRRTGATAERWLPEATETSGDCEVSR